MARKQLSVPERDDCFVISPISDSSTPERAFLRWKVDYLFRNVIRPVCTQVGFHALRMDQREHNQWIPEKTIHHLAQDVMAVAVLESVITDPDPHQSQSDSFNANVIYEIGLRHAWCRQVIVMCSGNLPRLPFDLRDIVPVNYPILERPQGGRRRGYPWTEGQLRRVKHALRARLLKAKQENPLQARFGKALRLHGESFGLELVCAMKRIALEELGDRLRRFLGDSIDDYEMKRDRRRAARELAKLLMLPKRDFFSDTCTYRRIAERGLRAASRSEEVVELCERMDKVTKSLADLAHRLQCKSGRPPGVAEIKRAINQLLAEISACLKGIEL